MDDEKVFTGVKEQELREMQDCDLCGKKVGSAGIFFYRVKVDQVVLDLPNLQQQAGLGMMLNNPALAMMMGADKDLAHRIEGREKTICADCIDKIYPLLDDE